jgi:hypothetical protein
VLPVLTGTGPELRAYPEKIWRLKPYSGLYSHPKPAMEEPRLVPQKAPQQPWFVAICGDFDLGRPAKNIGWASRHGENARTLGIAGETVRSAWGAEIRDDFYGSLWREPCHFQPKLSYEVGAYRECSG